MSKEDSSSSIMYEMTKSNTDLQETTLREAVLGRVMLSFELDGIDVARRHFEQMRSLFSGNRDWPFIEKEVTAFFLERKRQEQATIGEREQQVNQMWVDALAKNGVVAAQVILNNKGTVNHN
jgi:hypothetical protein